MIRDVNLVSYLPPFIAEYKEISAALDAEDPEFKIIWQAADRVLYNEFIATADEYGLSRYEKMLGIFPSSGDTLESRRARVQARWFNALPYTWRVLLERMVSLCNGSNFTATKDFDHYRIHLEVSLELFGQVDELERLLNAMLPCNMVYSIDNSISCCAKGPVLSIGGTCVTEIFFITNDSNERFDATGIGFAGSGVSVTQFIVASDTAEIG